MNLASVRDLAMSKVARPMLVTQKHSPKILFVAGTVGVIGAAVLACRATLKMNDVLDEHEKQAADLNLIEKEVGDKALRKLQIKTALDIVKLYAPSVGVGAVSVVALTGSHIILTKRNAGVMAAYAAVDRAYKEYRQRVATEFGEDTDRKFASGSESILVEEKTSDGKTKVTEGLSAGKRGASPYRVLFDETCHKWTREPGMNPQIIGMQQSFANDKLRMQGHLFLNEVYDMLGVPRTKAGAVVGWVYRHDNEEKTGDNYVSFGVFADDLERGEAFANGHELSCWLDFNVDGIILDLI